MARTAKDIVVANTWSNLRQYTAARIALGRSGISLPTAPHLDFQLAHARARNAVHHDLDIPSVKTAVERLGLEVIELESSAESRPVYLQRPDKGRALSPSAREKLLRASESKATGADVAIVIGDGLSAFAIEKNAANLLHVVAPLVTRSGWRTAPVAIVRNARVAIGDEIGAILGAKLVVVLIGERPGLSSPDSLGIYMTYDPRPGLTDESRNCISNVRSEGLNYDQAAHKLLYLMTEAMKRGQSGVLLKDEADTLVAPVDRIVGPPATA